MCYRYGVTREPVLNRQMLGLMARELTLVDSKARRHAHTVLAARVAWPWNSSSRPASSSLLLKAKLT